MMGIGEGHRRYKVFSLTGDGAQCHEFFSLFLLKIAFSVLVISTFSTKAILFQIKITVGIIVKVSFLSWLSSEKMWYLIFTLFTYKKGINLQVLVPQKLKYIQYLFSKGLQLMQIDHVCTNLIVININCDTGHKKCTKCQNNMHQNYLLVNMYPSCLFVVDNKPSGEP